MKEIDLEALGCLMLDTTKKQPGNNFRRKNNCPYCGYFCDAATMIEDENAIPKPGDLSFCIMCVEPSQFDKNLKLMKFDINLVEDITERNRLKNIKFKIELFWEEHPDPKRESFREKVK